MHFPALLANERLTQLQHSTSTSQYSGSSEATHNSPIQISCIVLIILGIVAKAAFAVLKVWTGLDYTILCVLTGIWYSRRRPTTYVVL
ncbi:uncharacterized protein EAF02_011557 [Botrytis sinoallii]|uniref:uncharacterized protein n=1 Tax=Botrytis sinoallii TaxID=1463999 RepID=UPI001900E114|nr:uncharacterized protein EAF02_011557 [Botrytis sinoallii]KAF7855298.1 hypothetical protein EAF02_011557 [Botrytis sinoallii]